MTNQNENAGERLWEDEWGNRWRKICNDLKHIEEWVELETELQENRDIKYKDELNEISDNKLEEMLNNKNKSKKWTL